MQRRCLLGLLAVLALSLPLLLATAARSQQVVHSTPAPSELELPNGEPLPTPSEQVRVICSLPEFQARPNLNATVVVFAWRRLESLRRLTRSLERAEYCGTEVPLLVLADSGASAEVLAYVTALQWSHGAKRLYVHEGTALGIRGMWIHMFRQAEGRNLMPFEDDIEVSPLYYWWLARMVRQYGPLGTAEQVRAKNLAGISLYTPRLNEIQYPQVKWVASKETRSPAFLLQAACSLANYQPELSSQGAFPSSCPYPPCRRSRARGVRSFSPLTLKSSLASSTRAPCRNQARYGRPEPPKRLFGRRWPEPSAAWGVLWR